MKKLNPVAVGLAIKAIRENAKMSATDVAKQAEMTASSYSRTENGYRAVELAEAVLICQATGTKLDNLVEVAKNAERSEHIKVREQAVAELQRSKAGIKEIADVVLQSLRSQSGSGP